MAGGGWQAQLGDSSVSPTNYAAEPPTRHQPVLRADEHRALASSRLAGRPQTARANDPADGGKCRWASRLEGNAAMVTLGKGKGSKGKG